MPGDGKRSLFPRKAQVSTTGSGHAPSNVNTSGGETPKKSITKWRIRDLFRSHEWMPQVRPDAGVDEVSDYNESMIRPAGRPPKSLTREQTDVLIMLIVKTDIAYKDIPAAMKDILDPDTGESASEYKLRDHWWKIFGGNPQDARLGNKAGQLQRLEDHREACKLFYIQRNGSQQYIEVGRQQLGPNNCDQEAARSSWTLPDTQTHRSKVVECGNSAEALVIGAERIDHTTRSGQPYDPDLLHSQATTPVGLRKRPMPNDLESSNMITSQGHQSRVRRPASLVSHSSRKRRSSVTPKTTSEVASKYDGIGSDQLQWYLQYRRSRESWFSRISRSSRSSSYRERQSQPSAPLTSFDSSNKPDLHDLLNRASYATESLPWALLSGYVDNYVKAGADVNGFGAVGETPLHRAVKMGCLPAVVALLEANANPNAKDAQGKSVSASARDFIRSTKPDDSTVAHIEVARELIKYNAQLEDAPLSKQISRGRKSTSSRLSRTLTSLPESSTVEPINQHMAQSKNAQYNDLGFDGLGLEQLESSAHHHNLYGSNGDLFASEQASSHITPLSDIQHSGSPQNLMYKSQMQPYRGHAQRFSNASTLSFNTAFSGASTAARSSTTSLGNQMYHGDLQDEVSNSGDRAYLDYNQDPASLSQDMFPFYTDPEIMPQGDIGVWPQQSMQQYHQAPGNVTIATDPSAMTYPTQQICPTSTPNINRRHRVINGNVHPPDVQAFYNNNAQSVPSRSGQENAEPSYYDAVATQYGYMGDFEPNFGQRW